MRAKVKTRLRLGLQHSKDRTRIRANTRARKRWARISKDSFIYVHTVDPRIVHTTNGPPGGHLISKDKTDRGNITFTHTRHSTRQCPATVLIQQTSVRTL